jgi:NAD(P)-dependent dehydrogenase (short-subunit alcohol dehydrogenase family)
MTTSEHLTSLKGATAVVTGASRGFGLAIARVLCDAEATVVGLARNRAALEKVRDELGDRFIVVDGDAGDPGLARRVIDVHRPTTIVLNAGAAPDTSTLSGFDWPSFSKHWESDVRQSFEWTRAALTTPLEPGSTVIAFSSGAALFGSPMSGGYAGSKATVRFISAYAADESERSGLGIRFAAVLPGMTPGTTVGDIGINAYSGLRGMDRDAFIAQYPPTPTVEQVALMIAGLAAEAPGVSANGTAYRLVPEGAIVI